MKRPHVSDKSINSWLAKVGKELTRITERPFGHMLRTHTGTPRYAISQQMASYERCCTNPRRHSSNHRRHITRAGHDTAFGKHGKRSCSAPMNTTEGTAQPEWLDDSERFGLQISTSPSYPIHGVRTPDWWRTYQDSNPGFQLRRLE